MLRGSSSTPALADRLAWAAVLGVVGLAAWNWVLDPDRAGRWAWAMALLPVIWGAISISRWWTLRVGAARPDDPALRRYADDTVRFLALVIAVLGASQAISLGFDVARGLRLFEGRLFEARVLGLMSGAICVVLGNGLPKILTPVSLLPAGGATRISQMRRFIGRSWVVVGLAVIAVFAFTPLDAAESARRWMFAAGVASMVGGIVWVNLGPSRRPV